MLNIRYSYWVENGELWVWDAVENRIGWHGTLGGEVVLKVIDIPQQDDCIVLLNYQPGLGNRLYGHPRNLARCQPDGSIVWQVGGPDTIADPFTDVYWAEEVLVAFSWSCYFCKIDVDTGQLVGKVFMK